MNNKPFSKGLGALIPNKVKKIEVPGVKHSDAIYYVDIAKITPNPYQPRKEFDLEALKSLSESIKDYGILQPLVVSKNEKVNSLGASVEYQLIAGERRLTAAKMAGLKEVPVIMRQTSSQEKLELSLIENVQRADLNPIERALAYKRLETEFRLGQKEIARVAGRSREGVANTMRLLSLPPNIIQAVRDGKISEGHARAILGLKEVAKQDKVFQAVLAQGLTVREVEEWVQKINIIDETGTVRTAKRLQDFGELENRLKDYFKIDNIRVKNEMGKPKIMITFADKADVESFIKRLTA